MSDTPTPDRSPSFATLESRTGPSPRRWAAATTAVVALAVGLFLTIAPWVDSWSFNYIQQLNPSLEYLWEDPAFRGALSGLGVANILIGLAEGLRAFRQSK